MGLIVVGLCALAFSVWIVGRRRSRALPLPPGPPRIPYFGNLWNLPSNGLPLWRLYDNLAKQYNSDLIYLNMAGTSIVIVNTYEAVVELLEHRSALYSSRPTIPTMLELMGWGFDFALMPYGTQWRAHRRMMHHSFHEQATKQFRPQQLHASRVLLKGLLDTPENFASHLRFMVSQVILNSIYGLDVSSVDHAYIKMAERAVEGFKVACTPGKFLVDTFPSLKYAPRWFPGTGFMREADVWREDTIGYLETTMNDAQKLIGAGHAKPSFVSERLSAIGGDEEFEESASEQQEIIKNVSGLIYGAGMDTTMSSMSTFMLSIAVNTDVQRKAQAYIDTVCKGELPTFEDMDALPYVTALLMETIRFHPTLPLVSHYVEVEDDYKGYRIPAGSSVFSNSWALLHDEVEYPEPYRFNPDRFLLDGKINTTVRDPRLIAFGTGRRICPGRHFAMSMAWIAMASILAAFDITEPINEDGKVIIPGEEEFTSFLMSGPKPFKCTITPRSLMTRQLVEAVLLDEA